VGFEGTPDAALVVVDNNQEWTCSMPCSLDLPRGQHTAIISKADFRTSRQTFNVGREPSTVKVVLPALKATVLVSSTPLGADVFVDGKKVEGQTNVQINISPGYHLVRVAKAGAGEDAISVKIAEGELLPMRFRLSGTLAKGAIKFESAPRGATLTLNGAIRAGVTPGAYDTPPGLYQASFSHPGHTPVVQEIEVKAGQTTELSISLSPQ
jgi:hypothetical protein